MIDIHSHILWGLDDGARTAEESVEMLKLAAAGGTTEIVATPHANFRYPYQENVVGDRIRELSALATGGPVIHRGSDFHLSFDNVEAAVAHPSRYCINGGPYLLVEFPDASLRGMREALEMLLGRGLIPIMTHPERQPDLQKINADFLDWIRLGCLVQVTGQSLSGRFGKRAQESAWEMLRRGYVQFVASDAHGVTDRTPCLDQAFAEVAGRCGGAAAEAVFIANPKAVVTGQPLAPPVVKRRAWYHFLK